MEKRKRVHTQIYAVCGKTDMRKGIDGLAAVIGKREIKDRIQFLSNSMLKHDLNLLFVIRTWSPPCLRIR